MNPIICFNELDYTGAEELNPEQNTFCVGFC